MSFVTSSSSGSPNGLTGPGSSTDNALVRWDGTTGTVAQNSGAILDDSNNLTGINSLTVTTLIATTTVTTGDNLIVLNDDVAGAPTEDAGLEINRGSSTDARLIWDETNDYWKAGLSGSEQRIALFNDFATAALPGLVSTAAQTFAGQKTFQGHVYVGNLPSSDHPFSVDAEPVLQSTSYQTAVIIGRKTASGVISDSIYGVYGQAYLDTGVHNITGQVTGTMGETKVNGTGTVTTANGLRGSVAIQTAGIVTNAVAVRASGNSASGGGVITNSYGFYGVDQATGTSKYGLYLEQTTGYAVYAAGAADNVFVGNISKIRNVDYIWPASQGAASTVLTNDGAGTLSWAAAAGGITTLNTLTGTTQTFATGTAGTDFAISSAR